MAGLAVLANTWPHLHVLVAGPTAARHSGQRFCPRPKAPEARAGLAGLAGLANTWPHLHFLVAVPTAALHSGQCFCPGAKVYKAPGARANSRLQCVHFLDAAPTTLPHPPSAVGHKKTTGVVGPLAALGAGAPLMAGPNSAGLASAGTTPGAGSTGITGMRC